VSTSSSSSDGDRPPSPVPYQRLNPSEPSPPPLTSKEEKRDSRTNRNEEMMRSLIEVPTDDVHNAVFMDRDKILTSLSALDEALVNHPLLAKNSGAKAQLRIVGGAAIILRHGSRLTTNDIDAAIWPEDGVIAISDGIAGKIGLGLGWLNDAAKRYIPELVQYDEFTSPLPLRRLVIQLADDASLLAMKCNALRGIKDTEDIRTLAKVLNISSGSALQELTNLKYGYHILADSKAALLEDIIHGRI
jgi:hypothetical protein